MNCQIPFACPSPITLDTPNPSGQVPQLHEQSVPRNPHPSTLQEAHTFAVGEGSLIVS